MLETVSKILFVVSTGALVPVMLALLGLAVWTLVLLGGLLREWATRVVVGRSLAARVSDLCNANSAAGNPVARWSDSIPAAGFVPRYLRACWVADASHAAGCRVTDEIELQMTQSVGRLSSIARLGPMLGLAGTLIPLGPGLVSLARGEVAGLASQLVVAFSTTVVGLLVGMIAYACAQVRRGWYARDLASILLLEEVRCARRRSNP